MVQMLRFSNHFEEFQFAYDAYCMTLLKKFQGAAMLTAESVSADKVQIVFPDDKDGDFLRHTIFDGHSSGCCICGGRFARQFAIASETNGFFVEWAARYTLLGDPFGKGFFRSRRCGVVFDVRELCLSYFFCAQDHCCGSESVFASVMMVEFQVEVFFQTCQSMTAVAFQLRPSRSRDTNAVMPCCIKRWQMCFFAGRVEGLFVEIAVLDERVSLKQVLKFFDKIFKIRRIMHCIFVNAVKSNVEPIKMLFRIDELGDDLNRVVNAYEGKAYLTDAGFLRVCGFDVNSDKSNVLGLRWGALWSVAFIFDSLDHLLNVVMDIRDWGRRDWIVAFFPIWRRKTEIHIGSDFGFCRVISFLISVFEKVICSSRNDYGANSIKQYLESFLFKILIHLRAAWDLCHVVQKHRAGVQQYPIVRHTGGAWWPENVLPVPLCGWVIKACLSQHVFMVRGGRCDG